MPSAATSVRRLVAFVAFASAAAALSVAPTADAQPAKTKPAAPAKKPEPVPEPVPAPEAAAAPDEAPPPAAKPPPGTIEPPAETWDPKDVTEVPGKTYLFVGVRYRGNIIPKFLLNTFVDGGKTIYSNTVGVELDIRKDNFSLIPALQFTEYGTGDVIFKEKDSPDIAGNYSLVNSSLKAFYATADLLWSAPISKNLAFEYGAGFGLGVIFGDLETSWVKRQGNDFVRCASEGDGGANSGCNKADHRNADKAKINYIEPSWFGGGSIPVIFPHVAPQVGLRFKPVKQFAARLGLGFSLTGPFFGLSGSYGLEQKPRL